MALWRLTTRPGLRKSDEFLKEVLSGAYGVGQRRNTVSMIQTRAARKMRNTKNKMTTSKEIIPAA